MDALGHTGGDGAAQGFAIDGDQLTPARLRVSTQDTADQRLHGTDKLFELEDASNGAVTRHGRSCEVEGLHQAGATPAHPVGDTGWLIFATQFGQHDQAQQQRQGVACAAGITRIREALGLFVEAAQIEKESVRVRRRLYRERPNGAMMHLDLLRSTGVLANASLTERGHFFICCQWTMKRPWSYGWSDRTYPVLFSLDANRSFPLYSTMSLIYETPGAATNEIVIVGVGYKVDVDQIRGLAQWAAWRTRDLTPERSEQTEQFWKQRLSALLPGEDQPVQSGGAPCFLKCLCEELIPFVEANYRVSATDRGLAGCSYGGLFTLYALFHAPEMFTRYFAGSPSMWDRLFEYEANYACTHADLKGRVFITAGALEFDLLGRMQRLVDRLRSRAYPGLELRIHVFEGEDHTSAYAAAVSRALRVLYADDGLTL